jgi:hypothetical protein
MIAVPVPPVSKYSWFMSSSMNALACPVGGTGGPNTDASPDTDPLNASPLPIAVADEAGSVPEHIMFKLPGADPDCEQLIPCDPLVDTEPLRITSA